MAQIERREARLRRLRAKTVPRVEGPVGRDIACTEGMHHHIGKSQNEYDNIGGLLAKNAGEPAFKVCGIYRFELNSFV